MEKEIITFIVPAYNSEATLATTIDSILRQTCDSYKIIIVNDGSTDKTEAIGKKYEQNYPDKQFIRNYSHICIHQIKNLYKKVKTKMKQFENYLSRTMNGIVKSAVILPQTENFLEIVPLLKKYTELEKIYCVLPARTKLTNMDSMLYSYMVEIYNISEFKELGIFSDMVLFDYNRADEVEILQNQTVHYMIGRMDAEEDYFSFWEKHKNKTQHIYIEYKHEIFEWEKTEAISY